MLSYFFCKQCEIINLKTCTWNFTVILGLSSFSMYSINYIQVWHMSGKDQERSHGILFWVMGSWHVWKKSRKTNVCSNQDISHSTDFFFFYRGNCFVDELWWISHNDSINRFFIPHYFLLYWAEAYIINTSSFPMRILHAFFNKNISLTIHRSVNFTAVLIFMVLLFIYRIFLMMKS